MNAATLVVSAGLLLSLSCNTIVEPVAYYRNKILFASSRSGIEQLYMMNPDGSDVRQITSGPYWHNNGRWSPDARQIICNTQEGTETAGIMMALMNADGSNRRLLRWGSQMAWSPDGRKIAFAYSPSAELGDLSQYIYIINSDGSGLTKLTDTFGVHDAAPSWSPGGTTIAFSSNRDFPAPPFRSELYLMNVDGSDQRRLTHTDSLINTAPTRSPSGKTIAFQSNGEIALINEDGTGYHRISNGNEARGYVLLEPRWSPEGTRIVAWSYSTDGLVRRSLWILSLGDGSMYKLLEDSSANSPDWSK